MQFVLVAFVFSLDGAGFIFGDVTLPLGFCFRSKRTVVIPVDVGRGIEQPEVGFVFGFLPEGG